MIAVNRHQRWLAAVVLGGGLLTGGLMAAPDSLAGQTAATPSAGSVRQATPGLDGSQCGDTPGNGDSGESEQPDPGATPEQENDGGDDATEGESGADDPEGDSTDESDSVDPADEASATPGALSEGQELLDQATISLTDATDVAQAAAQGPLGSVELEEVDGTLAFRVEIGEQDVLIDAADGTVISVSAGDGAEDNGDDCLDDDAAEANAAPGTLVEGQDLAAQATITIEQAIAAAQGAATGDLGAVGLEDQDGTLVYTVKIGDQEVTVDATTGKVVGTESDQED